jgi:hypothetical protein
LDRRRLGGGFLRLAFAGSQKGCQHYRKAKAQSLGVFLKSYAQAKTSLN